MMRHVVIKVGVYATSKGLSECLEVDTVHMSYIDVYPHVRYDEEWRPRERVA